MPIGCESDPTRSDSIRFDLLRSNRTIRVNRTRAVVNENSHALVSDDNNRTCLDRRRTLHDLASSSVVQPRRAHTTSYDLEIDK